MEDIQLFYFNLIRNYQLLAVFEDMVYPVEMYREEQINRVMRVMKIARSIN